MEQKDKIYVAGHTGLVGSSIMRRLRAKGYTNIVTHTRLELDLLSQNKVLQFFEKERPQHVFLAAAKVGGILANDTYPAEFIYENLTIQTNIIHAAHKTGVSKLLFLGSSCIYPRECPQPIKEEYLLTGPLEKTNEAYAVAKIAGLKMCEYYNKQYHTKFFSVMPTNLYGPGDNFDPETSHLIPALIRKFHEAKEQNIPSVTLWGTGTPRREPMYVDDCTDACIFLMETYEDHQYNIINIGIGKDYTIQEMAEIIKGIIGYTGSIEWDPSKPDGTPRKLLDTGRLSSCGWSPSWDLDAGIKETYAWFCSHYRR